jgi:hypothetical protein
MISRNTVRGSLVAASVALIAACQDTPTPAGPPHLSPSLSRAEAAQQAAQAFDRASAEVMALPGTVFADYDERIGRLVFGVENASVIPGVRTALTRLGLPSSTYEITITEPIVFMATLRERWRPTQGGIQIHFGQYLCTMGLNANDGTARSFITNSHCTNTQGGVEGTQYYQPTSSVDGTVIATEVEDPQYFRGGACPRGKKCRYSDASRALYDANVGSSLGVISKTSGPNNGSLEVTGAFSIKSEGSAAVGNVVNKVGRTTGWTQGTVTRTCVNTSVSGSNIMQLCQTFVESSAQIVAGGDSGSQVFGITSGTDVKLIGLLWGGNSNGTLFVFSPWSQVEQELGGLTTF